MSIPLNSNSLFGSRDKIVEGISRQYILLNPNCSPILVTDIDLPTLGAKLPYANGALQNLVRRRATGAADFRSPSITSMLAKLRIGCPESSSEPGHFRWFPHGTTMRRLIAVRLEQFLIENLDSAAMETPLLMEWSPELESLAGSFRERIYEVGGAGRNEAMMLRYGGDPGFFAMLANAELNPSALPWRVHELVHGFRRSRSGEVHGIQRSRSFTFFDCHSICGDSTSGMAEYLRVLTAQLEEVEKLGGEHAVAITAVAGDNVALNSLQEWVDSTRRSVLVELTSRRKHYYRLLHNIYDTRGLRLMHGQLDEANGARWRPDDPHPVSIVHSAVGSVERWMLVFLLNALDSDVPAWPQWLAPVQLRVIPVRPDDVERAWIVANSLHSRGIRTELDDRERPLSWRVRDSESKWIPYVVVIGGEEHIAEVRERGGKRRPATADSLVSEIVAGPLFIATRIARLSAEQVMR